MQIKKLQGVVRCAKGRYIGNCNTERKVDNVLGFPSYLFLSF
jgi:hypothetical protein